MMAFWAAAMVNNSIRWWLVVEMKYGIEIRHENLLKMSTIEISEVLCRISMPYFFVTWMRS